MLYHVIFGSVALHETVTYVSWTGIVLIFAGSVTIMFKEINFYRALLPAIIGNIMWGLQFITFNCALQFFTNYLMVAATGSSVALLIVFCMLISSLKQRSIICLNWKQRLLALCLGWVGRSSLLNFKPHGDFGLIYCCYRTGICNFIREDNI